MFNQTTLTGSHSWEAADALRRRLAQSGIHLEGNPGGWSEVYRVVKQCKVSAIDKIRLE